MTKQPLPNLSPVELKVIKALCTYGTNKEIAWQLGYTQHTAGGYIKNILRKTNNLNRTLLAVWAVRNGLDK